MRLIGHLANESSARTFGDYLYAQGIANRIENQQPDGWAVWVEEEDQLASAASLLADYKANPSGQQFAAAAKVASARRAEEEKQLEAYHKRVRERRHLFRPLTAYGFGPLTFVLIAASVTVFVLSSLGSNPQAVMGLFITEFTEDTTTIRWLPHLYEVRHGQIWRLITPIFIHFGLLHILFNMWCLRDLGSMIEGRQNTWILGALVLVTATGSNVLQFYMVSPYFGGMSGVLYALLGYVWIRGKLDPASGLFLRPTTVTMMIVWFFVCWTGLIGAANYAHTGGLLIGMAWGYLSALRYR